MPWTVRTPEGSLDFASLAEVERAYRAHLVAPEDELRPPGGEWIRAGTHPALHAAPAPRELARTWGPIAFALGLAFVALACIALGKSSTGLAVALGLTVYLCRITRHAARPTSLRRMDWRDLYRSPSGGEPAPHVAPARPGHPARPRRGTRTPAPTRRRPGAGGG